MKTRIIFLAFCGLPVLAGAQNYIQAASPQMLINIANPPPQIKFNPQINFDKIQLGNMGLASAKHGSKPGPKPKQAKIRQKEKPVEQIQVLQASFNPGNRMQADRMKMPKERFRIKRPHSNTGLSSETSVKDGTARAPQEKKLGVPLKYRIRYMRIRCGEKKAFRSKSKHAYKAKRKPRVKEHCFLAKA